MSSSVARPLLVVVYTTQSDRLLPFYEGIGLIFTQERHGSGPNHYASVTDTLVFEIYPTDVTQKDSTLLGFAVPAIGIALVEIAKKMRYALTFEMKFTERGAYAELHDPDGRKIHLYEP